MRLAKAVYGILFLKEYNIHYTPFPFPLEMRKIVIHDQVTLHFTTSNVRVHIAFGRFLAELKKKADLDLTEAVQLCDINIEVSSFHIESSQVRYLDSTKSLRYFTLGNSCIFHQAVGTQPFYLHVS